jgi:ATP-binding cassette subfamily B protein
MTRARRWWAPEVVQTSSMDCGPAALKCLLEGHHVPVGYGRLREACQTDVDGTSIDTLEVVAQQLGLAAQQQMLPVDHVLPAHGEGLPLPALLVVRHADVATHFVVAWRRVGAWVQVMDPALGRRWVPVQRLRADLEDRREQGRGRGWAGLGANGEAPRSAGLLAARAARFVH